MPTKQDGVYVILNNVINDTGNSWEIIMTREFNGTTGKINDNKVVSPSGIRKNKLWRKISRII